MKEVIINTEYITLGQLLKMMNLVATGGEVKFFLMQCKKPDFRQKRKKVVLNLKIK